MEAGLFGTDSVNDSWCRPVALDAVSSLSGKVVSIPSSSDDSALLLVSDSLALSSSWI